MYYFRALFAVAAAAVSFALREKKNCVRTWERKKASSELLAAHNIVHTAYQV